MSSGANAAPQFSLTEHVTGNTCRPCPTKVKPDNEVMQEKLAAKRAEEVQWKNDEDYAREHPRFRGICASLGNPLFSDTPVAPPHYERRLDPNIKTYGLTGYDKPQHPLYKTVNGSYGQLPSPGMLPVCHHPANHSFTKVQGLGGPYEDTHLNCEVDKGVIIGKKMKKQTSYSK